MIKYGYTIVYVENVKAGAEVVKEPAQKLWGQTVDYLRDINGFLVEVCTKINEQYENK